jgi:hypothetical protein
MEMDKYVSSMTSECEAIPGKSLREWDTPAYPSPILQKQQEIDPIYRDHYRSFVGRDMWWVKKVAPDCASRMRTVSVLGQAERRALGSSHSLDEACKGNHRQKDETVHSQRATSLRLWRQELCNES